MEVVTKAFTSRQSIKIAFGNVIELFQKGAEEGIYKFYLKNYDRAQEVRLLKQFNSCIVQMQDRDSDSPLTSTSLLLTLNKFYENVISLFCFDIAILFTLFAFKTY